MSQITEENIMICGKCGVRFNPCPAKAELTGNPESDKFKNWKKLSTIETDDGTMYLMRENTKCPDCGSKEIIDGLEEIID